LLIDSHAHLDSPRYAEDREAMLKIMDKSATALAAIAERLPEPTPPRGNRAQS